MSKTIIATSAVVALGLAGPVAWAEDRESVAATSGDKYMSESRIFFDFNSAELSPGARGELDKAAQGIESKSTSVILIEAHADQVGEAEYNKQLSERRAEAARAYLVERGVPASRIKVVSYGEGLPVTNTENKARVNRRIILFALHEPVVEKQTEVVRVPVKVPVKETVYVDRYRTVRPRPLGIQVMAGGGVIDQLDRQTEDMTELGGLWEARVAFFNRRYVGFEAAYIGSLQTVNAMGLDSNAQLFGNGAELNLRVNLLPGAFVRPYLFGGVGWTHYSFTNTGTAGAEVRDNDEVLHVPGGVGLGFHILRGMTLDLRGTVRAAFEEQAFQPMAPADGEMGLENWSASAQLGFEF